MKTNGEKTRVFWYIKQRTSFTKFQFLRLFFFFFIYFSLRIKQNLMLRLEKCLGLREYYCRGSEIYGGHSSFCIQIFQVTKQRIGEIYRSKNEITTNRKENLSKIMNQQVEIERKKGTWVYGPRWNLRRCFRIRHFQSSESEIFGELGRSGKSEVSVSRL